MEIYYPPGIGLFLKVTILIMGYDMLFPLN